MINKIFGLTKAFIDRENAHVNNCENGICQVLLHINISVVPPVTFRLFIGENYLFLFT